MLRRLAGKSWQARLIEATHRGIVGVRARYALLEGLTRQYLSGDAADKYLEFARNELGDNVAI